MGNDRIRACMCKKKNGDMIPLMKINKRSEEK